MHNSCGEIFRGFCRNLVRISESIRTTCYKINDFEPHSFSNFLIFSSQGDNDDGRQGGGGGQGCRWEGGEGVGHISVKIKLTTFCLHLTLLHFKLMFMFMLTFINFQLMVRKT